MSISELQQRIEVLEQRLDEKDSREAIRDLASDYCHGFDKRDYDRFLAIWWDDCVWDIGPPFGRFDGHAGIREAIYDVLWPAWKESHHLNSNQWIRFSDPDHARSVCDVACIGTLHAGPEAQMVGATYSDQLERRGGAWKILRRDVEIHYFNPMGETVLQPPATDT